MPRSDSVCLGLTAVAALVFWAKAVVPGAGGVTGCLGGAAAEAASAELACAAAAAGLLALSFSPHWPRWRRWVVPAARLGLFRALPWDIVLQAAPGGLAVDAFRLFVGACAAAGPHLAAPGHNRLRRPEMPSKAACACMEA